MGCRRGKIQWLLDVGRNQFLRLFGYKSNLTKKTRSHYMTVTPLSSPVGHRTYKEPKLGRGVFSFTPEHIAASITPVFDPDSRIGRPGFQKRCEKFNDSLKNIQPTQPIHTGNPEEDGPNLQRYDQQRNFYNEIEERACQIFQHNLKHCTQPFLQLTLDHAGGGGDSAKIRNEAIDAS